MSLQSGQFKKTTTKNGRVLNKHFQASLWLFSVFVLFDLRVSSIYFFINELNSVSLSSLLHVFVAFFISARSCSLN